jgi:hypothetical protein
MNEPELDALRLEVAEAHGLGEAGAQFLRGESLAELEAEAGQLAALVAEREQQPAPEDLFTAAAAAKVERRRLLHDLLCGRAPKPRDEGGRFAGRPKKPTIAGLDGGARRSVPMRRSPAEEHGRLIAEMAAITNTFHRGAGF